MKQSKPMHWKTTKAERQKYYRLVKGDEIGDRIVSDLYFAVGRIAELERLEAEALAEVERLRYDAGVEWLRYDAETARLIEKHGLHVTHCCDDTWLVVTALDEEYEENTLGEAVRAAVGEGE